LDQVELNQTADNLECDTTSKTSGLDFQHTTEVENGDDSEFGDFDAVPKPQDESVAFQDSDDFADFSSAGCNQATDWNAFEDEQKDNCSWAAFGDEQAGESHHRKEMWQSHRTDASAGIDGPVLHKTDSFALTSLQGTTSKQSQEPAPLVQVRVILILFVQWCSALVHTAHPRSCFCIEQMLGYCLFVLWECFNLVGEMG